MTLKCEYVGGICPRAGAHARPLQRHLHQADARLHAGGRAGPATVGASTRQMAACDTGVFIGGLLKTRLVDYSGQIIREDRRTDP